MLQGANVQPSQSRTYVIPVYKNEETNVVGMKKFNLPETEENTVSNATDYFYNNVGIGDSGFGAVPFEQYSDIEETEQQVAADAEAAFS